MWQLLVKYEPSTGKQERVKTYTPEYAKENQSWTKRERRGNNVWFSVFCYYTLIL